MYKLFLSSIALTIIIAVAINTFILYNISGDLNEKQIHNQLISMSEGKAQRIDYYLQDR